METNEDLIKTSVKGCNCPLYISSLFMTKDYIDHYTLQCQRYETNIETD